MTVLVGGRTIRFFRAPYIYLNDRRIVCRSFDSV